MNPNTWNLVNVFLFLLNLGCFLFLGGAWWNYFAMFTMIESSISIYMSHLKHEEIMNGLWNL